eukprot:gene1717-biopygen6505
MRRHLGARGAVTAVRCVAGSVLRVPGGSTRHRAQGAKVEPSNPDERNKAKQAIMEAAAVAGTRDRRRSPVGLHHRLRLRLPPLRPQHVDLLRQQPLALGNMHRRLSQLQSTKWLEGHLSNREAKELAQLGSCDDCCCRCLSLAAQHQISGDVCVISSTELTLGPDHRLGEARDWHAAAEGLLDLLELRAQGLDSTTPSGAHILYYACRDALAFHNILASALRHIATTPLHMASEQKLAVGPVYVLPRLCPTSPASPRRGPRREPGHNLPCPITPDPYYFAATMFRTGSVRAGLRFLVELDVRVLPSRDGVVGAPRALLDDLRDALVVPRGVVNLKGARHDVCCMPLPITTCESHRIFPKTGRCRIPRSDICVEQPGRVSDATVLGVVRVEVELPRVGAVLGHRGEDVERPLLAVDRHLRGGSAGPFGGARAAVGIRFLDNETRPWYVPRPGVLQGKETAAPSFAHAAVPSLVVAYTSMHLPHATQCDISGGHRLEAKTAPRLNPGVHFAGVLVGKTANREHADVLPLAPISCHRVPTMAHDGPRWPR